MLRRYPREAEQIQATLHEDQEATCWQYHFEEQETGHNERGSQHCQHGGIHATAGQSLHGTGSSSALVSAVPRGDRGQGQGRHLLAKYAAVDQAPAASSKTKTSQSAVEEPGKECSHKVHDQSEVADKKCTACRLQARSIQCSVVPLSYAMGHLAIPHIDLLKIDVEGDEMSVLEGILADDWPKIRQVKNIQ